ncbi:MAG: 50S ribosomal protein L15 [bacterium]
MKLHELPKRKGTEKKKKRVGRGHGCGTVKTAGRGTKGQKSRSGGSRPAYFEGGGLSMFRVLPKLGGFRPPNREPFVAVNVGQLNVFEDGAEVGVEALREAGIVKKNEKKVKLLGNGELKKKLTVRVPAWSGAAQRKVEDAGGKLVQG